MTKLITHQAHPARERRPRRASALPEAGFVVSDAADTPTPALKGGRFLPQPIDRTARRLAIRFCNASRARRFSLDPARRAHYARHRQKRFSTGLFGVGGR